MSFPLGKPILSLAITALLSGVLLFARSAGTSSSGMTLWTFDGTLRGESSPLHAFAAQSGKPVNLRVLSARALDTRLLSLFAAPSEDGLSPDVVEVEVGSIGKYFRPAAADVGFLPLQDLLAQENEPVQFLPARLSLWTRSRQLFGLPMDVHPVSLTYRKDLFDQAGIDPGTAKTWADLHADCLAFETFWRSHLGINHHALSLRSAAADYLIAMLQQRHVSLLDADNHQHLTDPRVAETLLFYARLCAGPQAVASETAPGETLWAQDMERGEVAMLFTPDWRAAQLKLLAPSLSGKLAMMPLPVFDPSDAHTGSWGGTMVGIPRNCRRPKQAWELALFLATHPSAGETPMLPAVPALWDDPIYHQPDPFYADAQSTGDLYVRLAREMPPAVVTPFSSIAEIELAQVLGKVVAQLRAGDETNLQSNCDHWLAQAADDLDKRIAFGTFDR